MQFLRNAAIEARLRLTSPIRRQQLSRLCEQGLAPMSVLFYHRVADSHPNDWTISRNAFRRHVDYCVENFQMIDLAELQRRVDQGESCRPTVTFTFDDGYAENADFAFPLLIEHKIPCVYFVTVTNIRDQLPFPHDVGAGRALPVNTVHQLRDAAEHGIEIGLHTSTHVDFAKTNDEDTLRREIIEAKDALEQLLGHPVRYFAVPYGLPPQMTPGVMEASHRAGLDGLCSAYGAYNFPGDDSYHVRRIHGDPDFGRLRNWLTYDARKSRIAPNVPSRTPVNIATPQSTTL